MNFNPILFGDVHISKLKAGAVIAKKSHRGVMEQRSLLTDADIPVPTRHTNEDGQTGDLYKFKNGLKSFIHHTEPLDEGIQLISFETSVYPQQENTHPKTMWHHTYAKPNGMVPDIDLVG